MRAPAQQAGGEAPEQPPPAADEIIVDPELGGTAAQAAPEPGSASAGDEIIVDPELSGLPAPEAAPAAAPLPPMTAPNGEVRAQLHSRVALDVADDAPREEQWELTQVGLIEARVRRSETLRFALGLRVRHQFGWLRHEVPFADRGRTALDLSPTAGYGDVTLDDGLHLRLGYQSVHLGSFELVSASDVLSVYDLRDGPTVFPEALEIAQLGARVDWDARSWLSVSLIAVPFFQPHRVSVLEGNYALLPRDEIVAPVNLTPEQEMRRTLSRAAQERLAQGALDAFAPDPNLKRAQAALHALAHGAAGELRLTAALARERLFTVVTDPILGIDYPAFGLFALEGTTSVGDVQVGAELAYMLQRALAVDSGDPDAIPSAERTDITHLGLRLEHARGERLVVLVEASAARTLEGRGREGAWLGAHGGRFYLAFAAAGRLAIEPWTFELGGGVVNGPSYLIAPRIELETLEGLYLEAGAYVIGAIDGSARATRWVAGEIYEHADQVFVGVRFVP